MEPKEAIRIIRSAYAERQLTIRSESELEFLLGELGRFERTTRDLPAGASDAETDDAAVAVAATLLRGVRLALSLKALATNGVPKIAETLETLETFRHGNPEHVDQFNESEYELHAASQFVGFGKQVSFVVAKSGDSRPSRFVHRVEFMVGYKWPVECKRPRTQSRIVDNVEKAIVKIDERKQCGIVCIGLENALPMKDPFLEVEGPTEAAAAVTQHLSGWLCDHRDKLLAKLNGSWARFLVLTYTVPCYYHGSESVALPSLRLGLGHNGTWVTQRVTEACIEVLKVERESQVPGAR